MVGTLSVIATPIGNLDDLSPRAITTLNDVDFIACEDTRVTGILLNRHEIKKETLSFNARQESKKLDYVIERILKGENCGLVSDAGTPGISDPGTRLVNGAIANGIVVIPIPGPSAVIAALSVSGLPTDSFLFEGFLPQKKGRQKKLQELANIDRTIVLYESVYRIEKLLAELQNYMPNRFVVVNREITKKFEESWRGVPGDIISELPDKTIKGEFVVLLAPNSWKVL